MKRTLVWFRQDLRLADNPALSHAVASGRVLAVYVLDTTNHSDTDNALSHVAETGLGSASAWWLHSSLVQLKQATEGHLLVVSGDPRYEIPKIAKQYDCDGVAWNRCYHPWQTERDTEIKASLIQQSIEVNTFNGSLLWEPWTVLKKDGTPYKVFTPFYRKGCLASQEPRFPLPVPDNIEWIETDSEYTVSDMKLLPTLSWGEGLAHQWQPGEEGAKQRLQVFLNGPLDSYHNDRNLPSITGTSMLSPHLHFGEISVNQIWYAAKGAKHGNMDDPGLDCYLSELGWREFSYYLLFHFPALPKQNFQQKFDRFPWLKDEHTLTAWQKGLTGYPIVDAGMRELYETGYMHNRVRMIVGSFLVKNLLLDWRHGERWFWDTLVDADLASNSASWQWIAGSGADAAPYFRIFNPITQGEKFDSEGDYVKRFCPELSKLPKKYIHKPFDAPSEILAHCGVELGDNYPKPIVDLKASRQRALDAFAKTRG